MAAKYWVKLYHEILRDPKMGRLPDRLWRRVIELFLMAGENDDDGLLPDVESMAWTLRLDEDALREDLAAMAAFGIIHETDDGWCVTKFAARQAPSSSTERTIEWRKRQARTKTPPSRVSGSWQAEIWKAMPESPGIYEISCTATGKSYVGASRCVMQRVQQHLSEMGSGVHLMSEDFAEHGPETIKCALLEAVADEALLPAREDHWMSQYAIDDLYNVEAAKRHRSWPGDESATQEQRPGDVSGTQEQRAGDASGTICPTDTESDTDTDTETPKGGGEPPGGVSFQNWIDRLRTAKGNERATITLELFMALYPKHDRPAYGRLGGAAKQVGGWSRLAQLLWEAGARPPVGDVLDFVTKVAKGKAGDRRNGKNGARAMPSDDEWLAQIKEERKSDATSGGQRG